MTITIETSSGSDIEEQQLPLTTENAVAAISQLDGELTTLVTMAHGQTTLYVASGPDQFTVTFAMADNRQVYDLVGNAAAEGTERRVIGGQEIEQPVHLLVSRDTAVRAALRFAETGQMDDTATWEEQV